MPHSLQILIDTYKIKDLNSGLGNFSLRFAHHLQALDDPWFQPVFLIPPGKRSLLPKGAQCVEAPWIGRYMPSVLGTYDLWHSLHQFPSFSPPRSQRWLLTVHDLNFLIEKKGRKQQRYLNSLQGQVDRADSLSTISNFSKDQIQTHLQLGNKQIPVIHNGIDEMGNASVPAPSWRPERPFLLSLGAFQEKKNVHVLLPALQQLPYDLVLAGNDQTAYGRRIRQEVDQLGLSQRVHLPGAVSEAEKLWLYSHCEAFLFPSLAEGFGMPVIEAMRLGKPVFINPIPALLEVGGDASFKLLDMEAHQLARSILDGMQQWRLEPIKYAERSRAQAQAFSWDRCIASYVRLYRDLLG